MMRKEILTKGKKKEKVVNCSWIFDGLDYENGSHGELILTINLNRFCIFQWVSETDSRQQIMFIAFGYIENIWVCVSRWCKWWEIFAMWAENSILQLQKDKHEAIKYRKKGMKKIKKRCTRPHFWKYYDEAKLHWQSQNKLFYHFMRGQSTKII